MMLSSLSLRLCVSARVYVLEYQECYLKVYILKSYTTIRNHARKLCLPENTLEQTLSFPKHFKTSVASLTAFEDDESTKDNFATATCRCIYNVI